MNLIGFDIGGTKTSVCIARSDGALLARRRMPSDSDASLAVYEERLADLMRLAIADSGVEASSLKAAGISAPGPLNVKAGLLLAPPNNPGWIDVPILAMVRRLLDVPVFLNNDANAGALAEQRFGTYHAARNLIYLTCSTGMGGGIIAAGRLVQGVTDMGGEVGHQVLDRNGPPCACGLRGCFEAYCGGRNIELRLRARLLADPGIETVLRQSCGYDLNRINHALLAAAVREGDRFALDQWDEFIERLAQGIGNLIMILNPAVILLGTIAIKEGDLVMNPLREKMPRYAWSWPLEACTIAPSTLGERIGDLGAIALALNGLSAAEGGIG